MKPQINEVRAKRYFICDYTGAPVEFRFFIPGKRKKIGCYATLPILLRHQFELAGNVETPAFLDIKKRVEAYFRQPDIPLQPELDKARVPLSESELAEYIKELPTGMGLSWLLVKKSIDINETGPKKKKKRTA